MLIAIRVISAADQICFIFLSEHIGWRRRYWPGVYLFLDFLKKVAVIVVCVQFEFSIVAWVILLRIVFRLHLAIVEHSQIEERAGLHRLARLRFVLSALLRNQVIVLVDLAVSLHNVTHGFLSRR